MSLRFRYRLFTTSRSVVPLGGRWVRPRPIVPVTLIGPAGGVLLAGRLDTCADDTVFDEKTAEKAGIDLGGAPTGISVGVAMTPVPVRYAEVTLRTTDGQERREWKAWVGFTSAPLNRPLLGFAGFLQFFTAIFRGDLEEVELTTNSLYRGT